jgi:alpha-L-rhamnosidase
VSSAPRALRVELLGGDPSGGDPFGVRDEPALSWWLPEDATVQTHYRIVTDDGYDSGRVASDRQVLVPVPVFTRSRRRTAVRVQVWTDAGKSAWSDRVALDSGLLHESDWTARWVGPDEPEPAVEGRRPAYWLRTAFDVDAPGVVLLHATALGVYEVFVNGVRVGDAELAPGYTQYAKRVQYQTHDVSSLLRPGRNAVAVLLADGWYRGQVGMPRAADQFGTHTAARVQLEAVVGDGSAAVLAASDTSWQAGRSHVLAADLIGGQREDRRLLDTSDWAPAVLREVDVRIVRPVAPPVRRTEEIRPRSVTVVADGAAQLVDLGQNINGWARLSDLGPAGTAITLRHGEHLDGTGDLTTAHLDVNVPIIPEPLPVGQVDAVVSAGVDGDRFEPRLTTHGFRYIRVEGHPHRLGADDVAGVVVHSDLRRTGWFWCSDARLNRLHDAVVWSLRGNMCAIPTDCPQRERAGWTGDWQLFAPTAAYLYDVLAFTRSWLRDVALDQRADGCVANMSPCPPAEGFDGPLGGLHGSAGWGDVVVSAPWDLYHVYADESLLRENWPVMRSWVDYAASCAAGARHPARAARRGTPSEHEKHLWDSGFHWGEWLEPDAQIGDFRDFAAADKSEVATAYLHRSANTLARIAVLLGEDADTAARYADIAAGTRRAWQAEFVRPDGSLRVDTQASHVRALAFGLVPDELRAGIAARLVALIQQAGTHLGTGFLSTPLLLPVLADTGHLEFAYAVLLQDSEPSWLTMIDRGATTVWERWNGVDADGNAHESLNHYSKGAVISFLHRYVAGLRATAPGYRTFTVQPRPGGSLTAARARFDACYGPIEVEWQRDGSGFRLDVDVPGGTTANIVLPDGARHTAGPGRHRWQTRA